MTPRNIILVLFAVGVPLGLGWLAWQKLPTGEPVDVMPENPVNPIVAKSWKGPGFLEFLPDTLNRYAVSYCATVDISDSTAGIAAARLPFLNERSLTTLHEAADSNIYFGHCSTDSLVIPWKSIRGLLSGEPGRWLVRFKVASNIGPDEMPDDYLGKGRTLEELDSGIDGATRKIGREMTQLAAEKRTPKNVPPREFFVDPRDQNRYPVAKIGEDHWMGSNLAYRTPKAFCPEKDDTTCLRKGFLYPYDDAVEACPDGWSLPSDDQWRELAKHLPRLDLSVLPTQEGIPYSDRSDEGFAPVLRGIRDNRTKNMRLESQAWWWSSRTCRDDSYCSPFRKKYIVHMLDDMSIAWGLHWTPRDSAARDGWSRMLAWKELGLTVRCVKDDQ